MPENKSGCIFNDPAQIIAARNVSAVRGIAYLSRSGFSRPEPRDGNAQRAGTKEMAQTDPRLLPGQGYEYDPETIEAMANALNDAIASLPYPLASRHVQILARSVICQAALGERDVKRLQMQALDALKR